MKTATGGEEAEMERAIIPRSDIVELEGLYRNAMNKVEAAFAGLLEAEQSLRKAGIFNSYDGMMCEYSHKGSWHGRDVSGYVESTKKMLLVTFWKYVVNRSGVEKLFSVRRQEEFHSQLYSGELPEFTAGNVLAFLQGIADSANTEIEEAVREVYDRFRPTMSWADQHKTNERNRFAYGEKLIVRSAIQGYYVSVYYTKWLWALDKAFHLLDGAGLPKPGNALVDAIESALGRREKQAETSYFKAQWFKNGNLHITFKRKDLLDKFNEVGGGARLRAA